MKKTLALLAFVSLSAWADMPLMFSNASVPMPPPGAKVAAGYLSIDNHSSKDINIVAASSKQFDGVEFHLSVIENDVAKMLPQSQLSIEAGASLELKHGGYHLMLMGPKEPLKAGQSIPVILESADGTQHPFELKVAMPGHHKANKNSHNMDHSKHGSGDKMMKMEQHSDGTKPDASPAKQ